nr:MAG TPA: tail protein [Caudoviricetes sp.]
MIELMESDGMTLKAPIDTAIRCGYKQTLNELDTATLELAAGDPVTELIDVPTSWVRLTDGEDYVGLYRVKSAVHAEQESGATVTYELESAECTLLDDMLIGHHELGGTELDTRWVLNYILARQSTARWELGACDFADQYQYNFEDVTLLEAIMSLGEVLVDEYAFVFDAREKPWTIRLRKLGQEATRPLVYGRNVTAIRRTIDGRIVTRLVGRGYGEGDNQLTVASVNGGKDYIDADAETMARYGVRVGLHADLRQTDPATLLARMRAILESGKRPQVSYEATCADLHMLTGEDWDNAQVGDRVLILDEELGETVKTRVTVREKTDIEGDPGSVKLTLDSSVRDTAEELNEILDKIGVQELYSQGATNLYSMQISDSCDADHPLEMSLYVPGNVLRINRCLLKWQIEAYRSYARLAKSGGGSTRTSEEGGGGTVTIPAQTISIGVKYSSGPMDAADGSAVSLTGGPKDYLGGVKTATDKAGNHSHNFAHVHALATHSHNFAGTSKTYSIAHNHSLSAGAGATGGIYSGNKSIQVTPEGEVEGSGTLWTTGAYDAQGGSGKPATGENGTHSHDFAHAHDMPHVHNIQHEHVIPSMWFDLEPHRHSVKIPEHTHDIEYGIYTGSRAKTVTIKVDGKEIPAADLGDEKEIDIAKYMSANADGRVTRSTWHKVSFVPDALTRITANLFFQVFIQSRGAGDY